MRRLVDSHVHFWDPGYLTYPWLHPLPQLNRPFLPPDFRNAIKGLPVEKIVYVQGDCLPEEGLAEVAWVQSFAEQQKLVHGIVAFAPLERGKQARSYLETLSNKRSVKGIRRSVQSEATGFCNRPEFIHGVHLLEDFAFVFDVCARHDQLEEVVALVRQCPDVSFVLDHMGKPDIRDHQPKRWRTNVRALGRLPNVACKISGLMSQANLQDWTTRDLGPYIDHAVESFGTDRILFGSDWPVVTLGATYTQWVATLESAVGSLSDQERDQLFYSNAASIYRLSGSGS